MQINFLIKIDQQLKEMLMLQCSIFYYKQARSVTLCRLTDCAV